MCTAIRLLACTAVLLAPTAGLGAIVIDFEDGTTHDVPIPSGHYLGLTFSNAVWISTNFPFGIFGDGSVALGVNAGTDPINDWAFPGTTSPIRIDFTSFAGSVSITAYDVHGNGARIEAYNSSNALLDSDQYDGSLASLPADVTLSVSGSISYVLLKQLPSPPHSSDGIGWDNLTYELASEAVPEPATLTLWGLGALGCVVAGYRRRKLAA